MGTRMKEVESGVTASAISGTSSCFMLHLHTSTLPSGGDAAARSCRHTEAGGGQHAAPGHLLPRKGVCPFELAHGSDTISSGSLH